MLHRLAALVAPVLLPAQVDDHPSFHVVCFVETERSGESFPLLAANKDWNSGTIEDYTTNHAYGSSRSSGKLSGWALALQPDGAWTFNLGDGDDRLDYRPTAPRQRVDDGELHLLAFSVDRDRNECRLYFDGVNVAIYSLNGIGSIAGDGRNRTAADVVELGYGKGVATDAAIAELWTGRGGSLAAAPELEGRKLRVLAWNIWHGGRRDGDEIGIAKTAAAIRESKADIVCMQETYGSGAAIADALGYYFFLRSSNLSVMSRFPIGRTFDLYRPFRFGGVEIDVPGRTLKVFSLWINHLPSVGAQMKQESITAQQLIAEDDKTRGREIRGILAALRPHIETANESPLIVAGDFNSPSHLDWTAATADGHRGLQVAWPVSSAMTANGFRDAYRVVHPEPTEPVGRTWSPRFRDSYQQRIDYVYYLGRGLEATAARMLDEHPDRWPSDHAAVLATLELGNR